MKAKRRPKRAGVPRIRSESVAIYFGHLSPPLRTLVLTLSPVLFFMVFLRTLGVATPRVGKRLEEAKRKQAPCPRTCMAKPHHENETPTLRAGVPRIRSECVAIYLGHLMPPLRTLVLTLSPVFFFMMFLRALGVATSRVGETLEEAKKKQAPCPRASIAKASPRKRNADPCGPAFLEFAQNLLRSTSATWCRRYERWS
jgi:hypothetical protein